MIAGFTRAPVIGLFVAGALSACTAATVPQRSAAPLGGHLDVLGPSLLFDPGAPPAGWLLIGDADTARRSMTVTRKGGVPAFKSAVGPRSYALVRPVTARLDATPFLDWYRYDTGAVTGPPSPRLVVGFLGGRGGIGTAGGPLPRHDRRLAIDWPEGTGRTAETWVRESADLAALYRRTWPRDDRTRVWITFIGIAAERGRGGTDHVFLSGLKLTR